MQKTVSNPDSRMAGRVFLCALLGAAAITSAGCPKAKPAPPYAWLGVARPPSPIIREPDNTPPVVANADDTQQTDLPVVITVPPERPAAPHRAAPPEPEPAKQAPPQISPQLSPQDQARAQGDTEADLNSARQNLNSVAGRQMNAVQQDLADKVRSFMGQAREAVTAGDWLGARNLAQKARVLSEELVHSF
jgi:hypothetical protein